MNRTKIIAILFLLLIKLVSVGQTVCDTLDFLNCDANRIILPQKTNDFSDFVSKINAIKIGESKSVQIVHIGDSHLQAGFLTEQIKQDLHNYINPDSFVSPGFVFPYTIAKTNNPYFFKVDYSGNWSCCKNVDHDKVCKLGLSGITVQTRDSVSSISIKMRNDKYAKPQKYFFNRIKILHNQSDSVKIYVNGVLAKKAQDYSIVRFPQLTDSIHITIKQSTKAGFDLYGIVLDDDRTKINYHTIGVNGATAQSYLKCDYFSKHLKLLNPDLVVISLGTNEAYNDNYTRIEHEYILKDLIYQIWDICPQTAIIAITANDHLKDRKYENGNILSVNRNILEISNEFNIGVWDFYSIMGGKGSINYWYDKKLTGKDKLHFRKKGYQIQGELFTKSLIDLIENFEIKE